VCTLLSITVVPTTGETSCDGTRDEISLLQNDIILAMVTPGWTQINSQYICNDISNYTPDGDPIGGTGGWHAGRTYHGTGFTLDECIKQCDSEAGCRTVYGAMTPALGSDGSCYTFPDMSVCRIAYGGRMGPPGWMQNTHTGWIFSQSHVWVKDTTTTTTQFVDYIGVLNSCGVVGMIHTTCGNLVAYNNSCNTPNTNPYVDCSIQGNPAACAKKCSITKGCKSFILRTDWGCQLCENSGNVRVPITEGSWGTTYPHPCVFGTAGVSGELGTAGYKMAS